MIAGLLLAAIEYLRAFDLRSPTPREVIAALGVGRSQAYVHKSAILDALQAIDRPPGRPTAEAKPPPPDTSALTREVLRFVMEHAGVVSGRETRRWYGDDFRRFVIDLRERYEDLDLATFAEAIMVPLGTVEDWLRTTLEPSPEAPAEASSETEPTTPQIESVISAYRTWRGNFTDFVRHVQDNLRIRRGATWIASILSALGGRRASRRRGRSPDAEAIRKAFATFFPGAQWIGDGTQLSLQINERTYVFNLELMIDGASAAAVGASIRDEEDSKAVTDAYNAGVVETGGPPLALLLDNKPSNHTPDVAAALGDTLLIRATPNRPENKAHVEGAFGLLKQTAPSLEITATTERDLAREVLKLWVEIWARTLNHRPRQDRGGRTRAQILAGDKPTPEQVEHARAALRERQRRQELAETRRRAREDPIARAIANDAFIRFGLHDPEDRLRRAIASYPLDAVLAGIAIFEGKSARGTLPPEVDGARYLLGIVRNGAREREGTAIAEALLRARIDARDRSLAALTDQLEVLRGGPAVLDSVLDELTATDRAIDRHFWTNATAELILREPTANHRPLLERCARRIHTAFRMPYRERLAVTHRLVEKVIPIDTE